MERILNMVLRMVLRKFVHMGVNKGMGMAMGAGKKRRQVEQDPYADETWQGDKPRTVKRRNRDR